MTSSPSDPAPLRLMIVAEREGSTAAWQQELERHLAPGSTVQVVASLLDALAQLTAASPDLVLLGIAGSGPADLASIEAVRFARSATTVVALLEVAEDAVASSALAAGAHDYLIRGHDVPRAIRRVLRAAAARSASAVAARAAEREQVRRATHDALTGLPVRALLLDRLDLALKAGARYSHAVAVAYLNLDGLRTINEQYGRDIGDAVLRHAATVLNDGVRSCDTLSRLGGDEFSLLLARVPERAGAETAMRVLTRLLSARPVTIAGTIIAPVMSFGLALSPDDGRSPEDLLAVAEARMYAQKREHHARLV